MGGSNPIKKIFKGIVKGITKIVKGVIGFIGDVVGFILNPLGAFDVPTPGNVNADQEAQGVTITKQGTNVAIPVVYGFRRVGGSLIFAETEGDRNKYLYVVTTICEGPIHGVKRIYVDEEPLPLPNNFYTDRQEVNVNSGKYKGRIRLQVFNGQESQRNGRNSSLADNAPSWNKNRRELPGVAYAVFRFEWKEIKTQADADNNPFTGGIPRVAFDIYGKKVYNIAGQADSGGTATLTNYDALSKSYSTNPANCLLDYMMNTRYGAGIEHTLIDAASFARAADKFNQTVTYNNSYSGKALTMNAVVDTNNKVLDNMKVLLAGCRSLMPYTQGKYKIKVEDGGNDLDITSTSVNVAFDVDKSYIIGGITLDGEKKKTKYNEVAVNYIDPDKEFTNQQQIYSEDPDYVIDNNEDLKGEFTFHTITNPAMAWETARMIYKKSRLQRSISFNATQELLNVEVGDIIRVTDSVLNLNQDTFRVVGLQLSPDLTVQITAAEHDATLYPATGGVGQIEIPPQLFKPDEISVNPRKNTVTLAPIGVVPPNDPDNPDDPPQNPLPDPPPIIEDITEFQQFPDAEPLIPQIELDTRIDRTVTPAGVVQGFTFSRWSLYNVSTRGLAYHNPNAAANGYINTNPVYETVNGITYISDNQSSSLDQNGDTNYIMYRNARGLALGDKSILITLFLNLPKNTAIDGFLYEYYLNGVKEFTREGRITHAFENFTFTNFFFRSDNSVGNADQIIFYWRKKLSNGGVQYHKDGSNLGSYTYNDKLEGKNVTGGTISDYLSFICQNYDYVKGTSLKGPGSDDDKIIHPLGE